MVFGVGLGMLAGRAQGQSGAQFCPCVPQLVGDGEVCPGDTVEYVVRCSVEEGFSIVWEYPDGWIRLPVASRDTLRVIVGPSSGVIRVMVCDQCARCCSDTLSVRVPCEGQFCLVMSGVWGSAFRAGVGLWMWRSQTYGAQPEFQVMRWRKVHDLWLPDWIRDIQVGSPDLGPQVQIQEMQILSGLVHRDASSALLIREVWNQPVGPRIDEGDGVFGGQRYVSRLVALDYAGNLLWQWVWTDHFLNLHSGHGNLINLGDRYVVSVLNPQLSGSVEGCSWDVRYDAFSWSGTPVDTVVFAGGGDSEHPGGGVALSGARQGVVQLAVRAGGQYGFQVHVVTVGGYRKLWEVQPAEGSGWLFQPPIIQPCTAYGCGDYVVGGVADSQSVRVVWLGMLDVSSMGSGVRVAVSGGRLYRYEIVPQGGEGAIQELNLCGMQLLGTKALLIGELIDGGDGGPPYDFFVMAVDVRTGSVLRAIRFNLPEPCIGSACACVRGFYRDGDRLLAVLVGENAYTYVMTLDENGGPCPECVSGIEALSSRRSVLPVRVVEMEDCADPRVGIKRRGNAEVEEGQYPPYAYFCGEMPSGLSRGRVGIGSGLPGLQNSEKQ